MTAAKLRNGDYVPDGVGGFASASGAEAVRPGDSMPTRSMSPGLSSRSTKSQ